MVHALKKAGPWLSPDGCVLVIHDLVDPPRVEIHNQDLKLYAGQLLSSNNFENQRQADQAVDKVVQEGIYTSKQSMIFENNIYAESLTAMLNWLTESWESVYLAENTHQKAEELVENLGSGSEVVLHMITRIVKLDPA